KIVNGSLNLTLDNSRSKPAVLRITDLSGRTMLSQTVNCGKTVYPVGKFAKGVYVLRISCDKAQEFHSFVVW
ncbi:MAG: T9SS type A sorting domain-containing protein, partial [Fibrobacter sp.]|nr:T9SS type A sorting domain-containing protein [Fibrobacter sp.]